MAIIQITRGIPRFNIQIGPIGDAIKYPHAQAIISVTDYFDPALTNHPHFYWIPINEIGQSWGYLSFFMAKKILDHYCLNQVAPLVYLCCSAGAHRSPLTAFCWLLSLGHTPETAHGHFFGQFNRSPLEMYQEDIRNGSIERDLPAFYQQMNQQPTLSYEALLQQMLKYERISYNSSGGLLHV